MRYKNHITNMEWKEFHMINFDVYKIDNDKFAFVIVMKTYEAPSYYLDEINQYFQSLKFKGSILIDQLLHSGNNNERFIGAFFDGAMIDKKSLSFEVVDRRDSIRKYICEYLRNDSGLLELTLLNGTQRKLISKGCYI